MKKMKTLLALTALCSVGMSLVSCGGGTTGDDNNGATTVNLTVWAGEEDQTLVQGIIDSFVAENTSETVNFNFTLGVQSESSAKDTVLADITAAADVFAFADDQLDDLVAAGALQSIDVMTDIAADVKARNNAGSVAAATNGDTLYALPLTADNGFFLYYDSTVLSEADVASYETLLAALAEKSEEDGVTYRYSEPSGSGWYLDGWFRAAGLRADKDASGTVTECNWNTDTGVDVVERMIELFQGEYTDYFIAQGDADFAADTGRNDGTYRVAAGVNGTWNANTVSTNYGEGYAATKLPTYELNGTATQRMSVAGFKLVGVNRYSSNTAWAIRFADYLTNEENQALRFTERGQGPSNTNAASNPAVQENVALAALLEQADYSQTQKVTGNFWSPTEVLSNAILSGMNGETDLITSGRGTANVVVDRAAVKSLLDTAVNAITAPAE